MFLHIWTDEEKCRFYLKDPWFHSYETKLNSDIISSSSSKLKWSNKNEWQSANQDSIEVFKGHRVLFHRVKGRLVINRVGVYDCTYVCCGGGLFSGSHSRAEGVVSAMKKQKKAKLVTHVSRTATVLNFCCCLILEGFFFQCVHHLFILFYMYAVSLNN